MKLVLRFDTHTVITKISTVIYDIIFLQILVLTIVIFALNGYVTRATSLDPLENVEIDETKTDRDDSRTKRSGNIFSSLLKKKLGLLGSLSGTSSGKSIGHSENFPEHFEEPLVRHIYKLYLKIKSNIRVSNINNNHL